MEGKYIILSKTKDQELGGFELDTQLYDTIEGAKEEAGISPGTLIVAQIVEVTQISPEEAEERLRATVTPWNGEYRPLRQILESIEEKVSSKD